ncbi:hypothetical protein BC829DRAFT_395226 [Chytridium lagenaria]|nr:hypothetical protein BC829DRAFT_395226 [Chytridium lagenaria]
MSTFTVTEAAVDAPPPSSSSAAAAHVDPKAVDDIALADISSSSASNAQRLHRRPILKTASSLESFVYDTERPASSTWTNTSDHAQLLAGKKSPEELKNFKKLGKRGKNLIQFYQRQNELIEELINPNPAVDEEEMEKRLVKLKIALYGSTAVNVILFGLQLTAAITSGSLALFATMADSFMDLATSGVLLATGAAASSKKNKEKYPTGKKRFETAGVIVFSCIMGALSVQLIIEGVRTLIAKTSNVDLTPMTLGLVAFAWLCKVGLYFYCVALSQFQTARILAQDHLNDITFNSVGIGLSVLGNYVRGGLILPVLLSLPSHSEVLVKYSNGTHPNARRQICIPRLPLQSHLHCMHHPEVLLVDTVRAYHSGEGFFVEVDIVLPPEMPLYRAHDIGEALQIKIEQLQNVERAFVHLDYETTHKPEHKTE